MRCPACGAEVREGFSFCSMCGHQFDMTVRRPSQVAEAPRKEDSKLVWIIVLIIVISFIAPIILSAILYFMVLGFGGTSQGPTPFVQVNRSAWVGGAKLTLTEPTADARWSDVSVGIRYGEESYSWIPYAWAYQNGTRVFSGGPTLIGGVILWLNITDLGGDDVMQLGDYFTMTTGYPYQFSKTAPYFVTILYVPTNELMCTSSIQF